MLTAGEVERTLFEWAPRRLAWERDNVGLIAGNRSSPVRGILVALDITPAVVDEAAAAGADLIVCHHPPIFHPLYAIDTSTEQGKAIAALLARGIAVVAMHTNADAAAGGINDALAALLGLRELRPLEPAPTGVDEPAREQRDAGTRLDAGTQLDAGTRCDVPQHGLGRIGLLPEPMDARAFIQMAGERVGCPAPRSSAYREGATVRRVAVCGGAGASLIGAAVGLGADAFVTADLGYHDYQEHGRRILLVDCGHGETEQVFMDLAVDFLRSRLFPGMEKIGIFRSRTVTNPLRYH